MVADIGYALFSASTEMDDTHYAQSRAANTRYRTSCQKYVGTECG